MQDHVWSQTELSECYKYGRGCDKNLNEAFKWAKRRAECQRDGYSLSLLGSYYANGWGTSVNEAEAFKQYLAAADEFGFADTQYHVGEYYLHGKGGQSVNKLKAIEWFMKATNQDHESAKSVLNGLH